MTDKIDEWVETACLALFGPVIWGDMLTAGSSSNAENARKMVRPVVIAVLDKHVKPMLADCRAASIQEAMLQQQIKPMPVIESPETYADRIIQEIKG